MARKKILLVDDSQTILMMQKMVLAAHPYDIVTARNGQEAIDKAEAIRPDLILMDVEMPIKSGLEACQELREHDELGDTPIILITSRGELFKKSAHEVGCTDFLAKPFRTDDLISKFKDILEEKDRGYEGRPNANGTNLSA